MRTSAEERIANRAITSTMKKTIKDLKSAGNKSDAESKLKDVFSIIDKASKKKVIHRNKAANVKSGLTKYVNAISE